RKFVGSIVSRVAWHGGRGRQRSRWALLIALAEVGGRVGRVPRRRQRGRPGQLEQDLGTARAIVGRFELVRAGWAARSTALDATQLIEGKPEFSSATALRLHERLLEPEWPKTRQEAIQRSISL